MDAISPAAPPFSSIFEIDACLFRCRLQRFSKSGLFLPERHDATKSVIAFPPLSDILRGMAIALSLLR